MLVNVALKKLCFVFCCLLMGMIQFVEAPGKFCRLRNPRLLQPCNAFCKNGKLYLKIMFRLYRHAGSPN